MKQKRFYTAKAILSTILFLVIFTPAPSFSAEIPITHAYKADTQQLNLTWPKYVHASYEQNENNLVFTFDYPIRLTDAKQIQEQSNGAIETVRFGYDILSLTLASGVTPQVTVEDKGAVIDFAFDAAKEESLTTSLLKIRLMAQQGEEEKALQQLDELDLRYPDNREITVTRADILQQTGNWQDALTTYEQVSKSEPHNEDLQTIIRALSLDHSPYADVNIEQRDTGDSRSEFFTRAEGEAQINRNVNIGLKLERNDIEVDAIMNPAINTVIPIDDSFHRGETYLTIGGPGKSTFKPSLFASEDSVGVGASYSIRDTKGATLFGIEYHAPNWDFAESVVFDGTRDRITLGRTHRFTPRFNMALQSGLNQYSLDGFDNTARSLSLDGTASYAISSEHHLANFLGHDATLNLRYTLDAEYAFDVETTAGGTITPLPVKTREVHGLVLVVGKRFIQPLLLEVYGGYALDRLGDDGIKYGADIFLDATDTTELRAGYQHSVSTEISSEDLDGFTLGLQQKF